MKLQSNPRRSPWPWAPPLASAHRFDSARNHRAAPRAQEEVVSNATIADSAHEATKKLAYECWERRGRPFGSPEMDWSAAQKALSGDVDHDGDSH